MSTTTVTTETKTSVKTLPQVQKISRDSSIEDILSIVNRDGGVIISQMFSPETISRVKEELDPALASLNAGSVFDDEGMAEFHGSNTKRLTNLVTISPTFRTSILDDDLVHSLAERVFKKESGTYWMTSAQTIEIGPGNARQPLHRDLDNFPPYVYMGPKGPEGTINFLIAVTDFTEENGATRVIPGSNHWEDFNDRGTQDMTIPAEMKAGDALFISGKVVHGGGANQTKDFKRCGIAFTFQPGFLTPEEAYPFFVDIDLVRTMSPRAQSMIAFRSQYPSNGSPGLWHKDVVNIAEYLKL